MILNDEQYDSVWDRVKKELRFFPNCSDRNSGALFPPFVINKNHVIYGIENTDDDISQMNLLITNAFIECTNPGERIYALDWQHSAFLYDPRNADEQQSVFVSDEKYMGGNSEDYA